MARLIYALLIVSLLLAGCSSVRNSPERAAEKWLKAVVDSEARETVELTCADESSDMMVFLQQQGYVEMILGIVEDVLQVDPKDIRIDISDLEFEVIEEHDTSAIVQVKGYFTVKIEKDKWELPLIPFNLHLVKEGGDWKVCPVESFDY